MSNQEEQKFWGYHYMMNAICDISKITDGQVIADFTKELVKAIDMVAYGEPQIVHFAAHDATKGGYTLIQLIETSNIAAHFVDATGEMYLDVFSCKNFDHTSVVDVVDKYFGLKSFNHDFLKRKAPQSE